MSRVLRSKSSTFLMELIFNLLLFCFLCSCGLLLFIKAYNMTNDTTALQQAVSLTSSIASIYESGDGGLTSIEQLYPCTTISEQEVYIYFSEEFVPCSPTAASYYILTYQEDHVAEVSFFHMNNELMYSITAVHHNPTKLGELKEVARND